MEFNVSVALTIHYNAALHSAEKPNTFHDGPWDSLFLMETSSVRGISSYSSLRLLLVMQVQYGSVTLSSSKSSRSDLTLQQIWRHSAKSFRAFDSMTLSHVNRLDELVGPESIPYPTNMSRHMLSLEE